MNGPRPSLALAPRIRRREPLVGTVLSAPDAALAELVCERFDFVWIDLEHGQLGTREVQVLAIAARAAGCGALVRLPHADSERLAALLDAGVDGVVAPRVEDAATARRLVERLRYPPGGSRGVAPRRGTSYGRAPEPVGSRDAEIACMVQIESMAGVENAREIAAVDGVDALVAGCSDLAADLGMPGRTESGAVLGSVRRMQKAAADAGIASGIAAPGPAPALARLLSGASTVLVYSSDVRMFAQAVDDAVASVNRVFAPARPQSVGTAS
jgi:4-hydroxy-2-oxoheptanedioate aldolase